MIINLNLLERVYEINEILLRKKEDVCLVDKFFENDILFFSGKGICHTLLTEKIYVSIILAR